MNTTSSSANLNTGTSPGNEHESCYLGPAASALEVMQEQIEYLFAHVGPECLPGCPECVRLANVRRYLLRPFLE